jgi:hypothetical protein
MGPIVAEGKEQRHRGVLRALCYQPHDSGWDSEKLTALPELIPMAS